MHTQPKNGNPADTMARITGPGTMAEKVALIRACESLRAEDERICSDPYAIRFLDPTIRRVLERSPDAFRAILEQIESLLPGISGAIVARVRCFDEIVLEAAHVGTGQIVIFGAGYDTRAYRINALENVRVFEVDHPDTIRVKVEKIREIFGSLPGHVRYVPADLESSRFDRDLAECGYDPGIRTLFVMEGLIMYLTPESVDRLLAFTVNNSPDGSSVVFDYCPEDDGKNTGAEWQAGRGAAAFASRQGEPLKSCISGPVDLFLMQRGFSGIRTLNAADLHRAYFQGTNSSRSVCGICGIASAVVDHDCCTAGELA